MRHQGPRRAADFQVSGSAPIGSAGGHRIDAVTGLCAFVALLLLLPSTLIIAPLGPVGLPAVFVSLIAFLWWCWHHLHRSTATQAGVQPVRWAAAGLLLAVLVSYIAVMMRPLPADEVSPADSSVLRVIALLGITLVANDGIRSLERMRAVTQVMILGGAAVATLSLAQFATGMPLVDHIAIPGLTQVADVHLEARSGLLRPSGTSSSPIEFGAVIAMVLPVAIMAAKAKTTRTLLHLMPAALMLLGVLISLSRTAIVCLFVGMVVIFPTLPRMWRSLGLAALVVALGGLYVTVPGMVGTLRGLFTNVSTDPSVQSRTDAYAVAFEFFWRSPLIGRGLGTFLPKYWIVDNMYLQLLVSIGVLGLAAMLCLVIVAMVSAWRARARFVPGADRDLATGIAAGIAAGATSFAFFDAFSFPQAAYLLFLLMGMAGAYWRIARRLVRQGRTDLVSIPESGSSPVTRP